MKKPLFVSERVWTEPVRRRSAVCSTGVEQSPKDLPGVVGDGRVHCGHLPVPIRGVRIRGRAIRHQFTASVHRSRSQSVGKGPRERRKEHRHWETAILSIERVCRCSIGESTLEMPSKHRPAPPSLLPPLFHFAEKQPHTPPSHLRPTHLIRRLAASASSLTRPTRAGWLRAPPHSRSSVGLSRSEEGASGKAVKRSSHCKGSGRGVVRWRQDQRRLTPSSG